jgi:uncharacterized protein YbjT (DUF2867 family)
MEQRRAVVAGATGLVGKHILMGLLADSSVASVIAVGRRPPQLQHKKLSALIVDFASLPALPPVDEVYLALGTTIKAAGSQSAFRAVDFEANLAVAKAALEAGARRCALVSAMGASPNSKVFYSRVKGELEEALASMPFDALVIARPSLLIGDRQELGQPERTGERVGRVAAQLLGPLIPRHYKPIDAGDVAAALLARLPAAGLRVVLTSGDMQRRTSA